MTETRDRAIRSSSSPEFIGLLYDVPEEWIPDMEERAAVMEFDGGLTRHAAESRVAEMVREGMKRR